MTALHPPNDGIGELMMRARVVAGHTQAEAAAAIGVSRRTWQRMERGEERSRTPGNMALVRGYIWWVGSIGIIT